VNLRRLGTRVVVQSAAFVVIVAFLLLLPAGTLIYWQAWTYIGLFVVATTTMSVYLIRKDPTLLERRLALAERGEAQKEQKVVQAIAGPSFLLMFLVSGLDLRFGWSRVPFAVVVVADLLVVAAFVVVFLVFRENTFTSAVVEVVPGQRAVTTGPYRIVRHPMYSGALLLLAATPVALGSWWAEWFLVPLATAIVVRLMLEERYLEERLAGYREYMQATRWRLVPRVW
jgi:protein-S-isoprenylcysteine O-methyltransferase Ste14